MIASLQGKAPQFYSASATTLEFDYRFRDAAQTGKITAYGAANARIYRLQLTNAAATVGSSHADLIDPKLVADTMIQEKAYQLKQAIDFAKDTTGASRVIVVGHSQGGLVARAYLQSWAFAPEGGWVAYSGDVETLVTIDTPHKGARLPALAILAGSLERGCVLGAGRSKFEMLPGSAFLTELNRPDDATPYPSALPASTRTISIVTRGDLVVDDNSQTLKTSDLPYEDAAHVLAEEQVITRVSCASQFSSPEIHACAPQHASTIQLIDNYLRGRPSFISADDVAATCGIPLVTFPVRLLDDSGARSSPVQVVAHLDDSSAQTKNVVFEPGTSTASATFVVPSWLRCRQAAPVSLHLTHPRGALLRDAKAVGSPR
jgi:pimeloyl-ACP methyl ester carboxylesterase